LQEFSSHLLWKANYLQDKNLLLEWFEYMKKGMVCQ